MKKIALIGSTGSIGRQVCAVVRRHPEQFYIEALVANGAKEEFLRQVHEFKPRYAALADERVGAEIAQYIPDGVMFACGKQAALEGVCCGDTAVVAVTGFAGLEYALKAIEESKHLALANKETLVCGGDLVMSKINGTGMRLMPIDSEHSAIWQALGFRLDAPFKRLIITASGGPFYGKTREELSHVTPEQALNHPTWKMGAKITVDSATLLNKGFEVIEAHHLYQCPYDKIHTLVQPTSIIHSMVEFADNGILAQMSYPTMELPIQLALTYPDRLDCALPAMDFERLGKIEFLPLNRQDFPCYDLALTAGGLGDNYPCALNAAGEVAVQAFLQGRISYLGIADTMQETLGRTERNNADSLETLQITDARARMFAEEYIKTRGK